MPRFAPHGPVVPDRLVQDLEDDRVVIFCGAGISMGAGLPSYTGLVAHGYHELGIPLPGEKSEEWLWPDRMLGVLESRCTREEVRRVVVDRLSQAPTDLEMHEAILKLARLNRVQGLRLVTTNFDTLFEVAQADFVFGKHIHSGPVLPIPRNDRIASWRSIAYLHGRIAASPESNDHLVMTSGDFGRAYLTEGWAARFVTRLFNDFTVLFIGYSLNDPVLRYMTDAFAAEEEARFTPRRGPAYIFVPYKGRRPPDPEVWRNRLLEPIFYNQGYQHLRLKQTLMAWAAAREDFLSSTGAIVERLARSRPQALDPSDTNNLLWAIVGRPNDGGHGARVFAQLSEVPPIEWLLEIERFEFAAESAWREALLRVTDPLKASVPEPKLHLRLLTPASAQADAVNLTQTAVALSEWIVRHLDRVELVDWVVGKLERGCRLHPVLRRAVRDRLAKAEELGAGFRLFWRIVAAEGAWSHTEVFGPAWYDVVRRLPGHADEPWFWQELYALFRPYLQMSKAILRDLRDPAYPDGDKGEPVGESLGTVAEARVRLTARENVQQVVQAIDHLSAPNTFLAEHVVAFTGLLRDALDLFAIVEPAGVDWDRSVFDRPSIRPHDQNHSFREWTVLFDLIWRGWQWVDDTDADRSRQIVQLWRALPYLAFRRLVIASMAASPNFTEEEKLEALLDA